MGTKHAILNYFFIIIKKRFVIVELYFISDNLKISFTIIASLILLGKESSYNVFY